MGGREGGGGGVGGGGCAARLTRPRGAAPGGQGLATPPRGHPPVRRQNRGTMAKYKRVFDIAEPTGLRWDVPPYHQGQIVEVAYADARPEAAPADSGAEYKRVTDRSDRSVTYYAPPCALSSGHGW